MSTDNANKLMQSPAENFIILRSVYGKVGMKYYIQPSKDPRTGQYPPCVKPVNSLGDIVLSEKEKEESGGYDAILLYWVKIFTDKSKSRIIKSIKI